MDDAKYTLAEIDKAIDRWGYFRVPNCDADVNLIKNGSIYHVDVDSYALDDDTGRYYVDFDWNVFDWNDDATAAWINDNYFDLLQYEIDWQFDTFMDIDGIQRLYFRMDN